VAAGIGLDSGVAGLLVGVDEGLKLLEFAQAAVLGVDRLRVALG
jgi:hypothetical protein